MDAVLLTEDEASIVFCFTHSYFLVDADCPYLLVDFLKSIMPLKRRAELYTSIGYNKHGKTELYRDLYCHLQDSDDRFELARGRQGHGDGRIHHAVLRRRVQGDQGHVPLPQAHHPCGRHGRYQFVFKHDRAGRLVDAQEFEHLAFDRAASPTRRWTNCSPFAATPCRCVGDTVDIRHLYTERRLTPLNLYLREQPGAGREAAVLDYGQAIKDMAATNIFPGDLFMKNFGVTRHGRVVFYDYDELCLLDQCNFRVIPQSRDAYDDLGDAQPWFSVAENDIFPEEFRFPGARQAADARLLRRARATCSTPGWWRRMQARLAAGEVMDLFPYPQSKRAARRTDPGAGCSAIKRSVWNSNPLTLHDAARYNRRGM